MSSTRASRHVEKKTSVTSDPKNCEDHMVNQIRNDWEGDERKYSVHRRNRKKNKKRNPERYEVHQGGQSDGASLA